MANHQARKTRVLGFESLERRETPSTFAGTAPLAEMAAHVSARSARVNFKGFGAATLATTTPLSDGSTFNTSTIAGSANLLGNYAGQANTIVSANNLVYHSIAALQASNGETLFVSLSGIYHGKITSTVSRSRGTYTITGGTGQFLNATGHGTVTGTLTVATGQVTFNFLGTLQEHPRA